ncbi:CPBP family intramembrane glutamic endopeptidase [Yeosuana marina]|uniref:CPBP family intramembrane glutamic endopeptidase n=1 Tax=Yeosuana marina TaxID=1565536 RepID=UPI0030C87947
MYISQAFKGLHEWWRYLIGLSLIVLAVILGQIPFTAAVMAKAYFNGDSLFNMNEQKMMSLLESNLNLFLMLLSFAVGLAGLLLVTKYLHKLSFIQITTSRKKIDWNRFWFIFFLWGIISSSFVLIEYYNTPENYVVNFKWIPFLILCIVAIIMVPLQTSFEEYLFRGYLMQGIGVVLKNKWAPLILTSVVFGSLHYANPEVDQLGDIMLIYYIGTGFFLGIMTLMDEGLELSLGFHAANNLFTALLVTADWTAFQTHSIFKDISEPEAAGFTDIFVPLVIVFPIILLILSKKYKWANWKDKLFGKVLEPQKEN